MAARLRSILAATDLSTTGTHAMERATMLAARSGGAQMRVLHAPKRPLQVISDASKGSDLVVLGGATEHSFRDLVLGSTAERLLRKTPASLLVVRNRPQGEYRRALVALDFSEFDDRVLAFARSVAPEARFDLMHAFDTRLEGKMRYAGVDPEAITEYRARTWESAMREMRLVADRIPGHPGTIVVNGHTASNVVRQGRAANADLIVVGHRPRSWLSRMMMSGIAAEVLPKAQTDVLVVRR